MGVRQVVGDAVEAVEDELAREMSLVKVFFASLGRGGWLHAAEQVGRKLLALAVPVGEVLALGTAAFIVYAVIKSKDAKKHEVILDGRVSPDREPPRDIMKPHFFQNRQGLWIHHGLWWNAEKYGEAKGVVVMLHGHSEHHRRFVHVAEHFNERGLAVFGMDHQGFGRSEGDRGHVEQFEHYVDDAFDFLRQVVYEDHAKWRSLPRFLAAHSMGSLIAIHVALRCQTSEHPAHKISGIMLSAPAVKVDPARNTWYLRAAGAVLDTIIPKAQVIGFPTYPSTSFLQVKLHATFDPLNYHGMVRIHQGLELLRGTAMALEHAPAFTTPVLIVHGEEDMHADISGSRSFIEKIASEDKTLLELPGIRHEPWQEERAIRDPILDFVANWAVAHVDSSVPAIDLKLLQQVPSNIFKCAAPPSAFKCGARAGAKGYEYECEPTQAASDGFVKL